MQHGWELVAYFSAAEARKLAFAKVIRYATGNGEMEEGILGN